MSRSVAVDSERIGLQARVFSVQRVCPHRGDKDEAVILGRRGVSAWWNLVFSGRVGFAHGHIAGVSVSLSFDEAVVPQISCLPER